MLDASKKLFRWRAALDGVEVVFHLAALAHQLGVRDGSRAVEFDTVNHFGTRRLAEVALVTPGVRRIVFLSSVAAVSSFADRPVDLRTIPSPVDDYGRSKHAAEVALADVLSDGPPDWCTLRPPLVYGPGNPGNMGRLQRLVKTGLPLPFGALHNRRSFVYVGSLVDALLTCASHPAASRRTFFVTDGEVLSTPELARRIAEGRGVRSRLVSVPLAWLRLAASAGDAVNRILGRSVGIDTYALDRLAGSLEVDGSEIERVLDWRRPYTGAEGLIRTLESPVGE